MAAPPDFVAGQILTAAQMNLAGSWVVKRDTIASGGSSATISNAFNADFTHYRVLIHNISVAAGTPTLLFQLRAGITTQATNYQWGGSLNNYAGGSALQANGTSSWQVGAANNTASGHVDCMIYRPFDAAITGFYSFSATGNAAYQIGGVQTNATSFDQLVISLGSSTFNAIATVIIIGMRD
jgi:hypothetical protein